MILKTVWRSTNVFVQMDFAEDYKCSTQDEVQPPYSNLTLVTIHPTMVYLKQNNSLVQHYGRFCRLCKIQLSKLLETDYDDDEA